MVETRRAPRKRQDPSPRCGLGSRDSPPPTPRVPAAAAGARAAPSLPLAAPSLPSLPLRACSPPPVVAARAPPVLLSRAPSPTSPEPGGLGWRRRRGLVLPRAVKVEAGLLRHGGGAFRAAAARLRPGGGMAAVGSRCGGAAWLGSSTGGSSAAAATPSAQIWALWGPSGLGRAAWPCKRPVLQMAACVARAGVQRRRRPACCSVAASFTGPIRPGQTRLALVCPCGGFTGPLGRPNLNGTGVSCCRVR